MSSGQIKKDKGLVTLQLRAAFHQQPDTHSLILSAAAYDPLTAAAVLSLQLDSHTAVQHLALGSQPGTPAYSSSFSLLWMAPGYQPSTQQQQKPLWPFGGLAPSPPGFWHTTHSSSGSPKPCSWALSHPLVYLDSPYAYSPELWQQGHKPGSSEAN